MTYTILQGVALVNASALVKSIYKGIDDVSLVNMREGIYKGVVANRLVNHYLQGRTYVYKGILKREPRDLQQTPR